MKPDSFDDVLKVFRDRMDTVIGLSSRMAVPDPKETVKQLLVGGHGPDPYWLLRQRQQFFAGKSVEQLLNSQHGTDFCLELFSGGVLRYYLLFYLHIFFEGAAGAVAWYLDGDGLFLETEMDFPMAHYLLENPSPKSDFSDDEAVLYSKAVNLAEVFKSETFKGVQRNDNLDRL